MSGAMVAHVGSSMSSSGTSSSWARVAALQVHNSERHDHVAALAINESHGHSTLLSSCWHLCQACVHCTSTSNTVHGSNHMHAHFGLLGNLPSAHCMTSNYLCGRLRLFMPACTLCTCISARAAWHDVRRDAHVQCHLHRISRSMVGCNWVYRYTT